MIAAILKDLPLLIDQVIEEVTSEWNCEMKCRSWMAWKTRVEKWEKDMEAFETWNNKEQLEMELHVEKSHLKQIIMRATENTVIINKEFRRRRSARKKIMIDLEETMDTMTESMREYEKRSSDNLVLSTDTEESWTNRRQIMSTLRNFLQGKWEEVYKCNGEWEYIKEEINRLNYEQKSEKIQPDGGDYPTLNSKSGELVRKLSTLAEGIATFDDLCYTWNTNQSTSEEI